MNIWPVILINKTEIKTKSKNKIHLQLSESVSKGKEKRKCENNFKMRLTCDDQNSLPVY